MSKVKNPALPERINVMRLVTYDVQMIAESIHEEEGKPFDEITIEDCLTRIEDWVRSDFGATRGLIYQDEHGNDL